MIINSSNIANIASVADKFNNPEFKNHQPLTNYSEAAFKTITNAQKMVTYAITYQTTTKTNLNKKNLNNTQKNLNDIWSMAQKGQSIPAKTIESVQENLREISRVFSDTLQPARTRSLVRQELIQGTNGNPLNSPTSSLKSPTNSIKSPTNSIKSPTSSLKITSPKNYLAAFSFSFRRRQEETNNKSNFLQSQSSSLTKNVVASLGSSNASSSGSKNVRSSLSLSDNVSDIGDSDSTDTKSMKENDPDLFSNSTVEKEEEISIITGISDERSIASLHTKKSVQLTTRSIPEDGSEVLSISALSAPKGDTEEDAEKEIDTLSDLTSVSFAVSHASETLSNSGQLPAVIDTELPETGADDESDILSLSISAISSATPRASQTHLSSLHAARQRANAESKQRRKDAFKKMGDLLAENKRLECISTKTEENFGLIQEILQSHCTQALEEIKGIKDWYKAMKFMGSFKNSKETIVSEMTKKLIWLEALKNMIPLNNELNMMPGNADQKTAQDSLKSEWKALDGSKPEGIYAVHFDLDNNLILSSLDAKDNFMYRQFRFSDEMTVCVVSGEMEIDYQLEFEDFKRSVNLNNFKKVDL
jgi:hypothetical protein